MPDQSSRRIITNRQLNFTLSPVDLHNPKEMPYSLSNYAIDGTWNHLQSIILDVILERMFNFEYRNFESIPKSWRSKQVSNVIPTLFDGAINKENFDYICQTPIEAFKLNKGEESLENYRWSFLATVNNQFDEKGFDEYLKKYSDYEQYKEGMDARTSIMNSDKQYTSNVKTLVRDYPILKKYRYKMIDIIKRISETKFRMDYRVKYIVDPPEYNEETKRFSRGKLIPIEYQMNDFQNIFDAMFIKDDFAVNFKSPLGKLIIHNMLILDTDWIPEEAFKLNKNAYFIYKKFILGKVAGKNKAKEIRLWFEDIKSFLGMQWSNDRGVHKTIDKAFKDMLAKGLVTGYSWNKDHYFRQYVLRFEHPQEGVEKQPDKGDKVMKLPA